MVISFQNGQGTGTDEGSTARDAPSWRDIAINEYIQAGRCK